MSERSPQSELVHLSEVLSDWASDSATPEEPLFASSGTIVNFATFLRRFYQADVLSGLQDAGSSPDCYWRQSAERVVLRAGTALMQGRPRPAAKSKTLSAAEMERLAIYGERAAQTWQWLVLEIDPLAGTDPEQWVKVSDLVSAWQGTLLRHPSARTRQSPLAERSLLLAVA
jgi:hypothetical protein